MSLPAEIDLTPRFTALGLPRREQGKRPTCSVFTVAHALDYALGVATGSGVPVSVEYLNWAARQERGRTDDGGFFSEIWTGYETLGCCPEAVLPYRPEYDATFQPEPLLQETARRSRPAERMERIRAVLAGGHPVCGGLRWPRKPVWTDDALEVCPPEDVFDGHSVLLIGYRTDDALPGGGAFRIRNSNEPASGFLPYAYVSEYLNDAAWIAPAAPMETPP
jgi:hypothetical protein